MAAFRPFFCLRGFIVRSLLCVTLSHFVNLLAGIMGKHKKKCRGMTLTEVSIVAMIVGLVLSGLWVAVDAVYRNSRVTATNKQILEVVSRIRSLYGISQSRMMDMTISGAAGASTLAQTGAIPDELIDRSVTPPAVIHAWHDAVSITAVHTNTDGDSFTIGFDGVPQTACTELLIRLSGATRDAGLITAGAGGTLYDKTAMPIGLSAAVSACPTATNDLRFTFMLRS